MTAAQIRDAARRYCLATGVPPDALETKTRNGKTYSRPAWWWQRERVKQSHAMLMAICEAMENRGKR